MTTAVAVADPRQVETRLVSQLATLPGVKIRENHRIGKDGQFETGPLTVLLDTTADIPAIQSMVDVACQPAPIGETVRALTRLALMTAHQTEWSEAKLSAYTDVLADYPGDAVLETLTNWHKRGNRWFPTVPELVEVIEIKARRRLRIRDAVRRAAA